MSSGLTCCFYNEDYALALEFFVEKNVAFGIELKYTTFFDTDIEVNGQPATLSPEFVSLTAGICIFFP
jgi:hypothetical protein